MLEKIRVCTKCNLCKNQGPLLDNMEKCQVFWVGLSAKKISCDDEKPLSPSTNSGRLVCSIEERCSGISTYKTNLVKCAPLDEHQKLRYPNRKEIESCLINLENEINELLPQIVFLLGDKVTKAISKQFKLDFSGWDGFNYTYIHYKGAYYVPIHHPSYIHVYKRKQLDTYISSVANLISTLI